MSITIGIIAEGMLIAATADSTMAAIAELADATGVNVQERWASAQDYLQWRDSLANPDQALSGSAAGDGSEGAGNVPVATQDQVRSEAATNDEEGGKGARTEQPGGSQDGVRVAPEATDDRCVVCGPDSDPLPAGLVELAKERFGQPLCQVHGRW